MRRAHSYSQRGVFQDIQDFVDVDFDLALDVVVNIDVDVDTFCCHCLVVSVDVNVDTCCCHCLVLLWGRKQCKKSGAEGKLSSGRNGHTIATESISSEKQKGISTHPNEKYSFRLG